MSTEPFRWVLIERLLDLAAINHLANAYPVSGFEATVSDSTSKSYSMWRRTLLDRNQSYGENADLDPMWHALLRDLRSHAYQQAIENLLGVDLAGHQREVVFWKYGADCRLSPHTDKPDKTLTHLFYFNEGWDRRWGGTLRLLNSSNADDVAHEIVPNRSESLAFVRSEASWHCVAPVTQSAIGERLSLQVVFWRPEAGVS